MKTLLLDENLSHETAAFLRSHGFIVKTAVEEGLGHADDASIAQYTVKHKYLLVTFDLDFAEMYYFSMVESLSVIVLRLRDQTVESVNTYLVKLLKSPQFIKTNLDNALIVANEHGFRIRRMHDDKS